MKGIAFLPLFFAILVVLIAVLTVSYLPRHSSVIKMDETMYETQEAAMELNRAASEGIKGGLAIYLVRLAEKGQGQPEGAAAVFLKDSLTGWPLLKDSIKKGVVSAIYLQNIVYTTKGLPSCFVAPYNPQEYNLVVEISAKNSLTLPSGAQHLWPHSLKKSLDAVDVQIKDAPKNLSDVQNVFAIDVFLDNNDMRFGCISKRGGVAYLELVPKRDSLNVSMVDIHAFQSNPLFSQINDTLKYLK